MRAAPAAGYHVAQLTVARMLAPLEDPQMAGFVARLDEVNAVADASPGFVWRLQTPDGDATAVGIDDDPTILVNLSVWSSIEALREYVYGGNHLAVLRRKRDWFGPYGGPHLVLWWLPAGRFPTVVEAQQRLDRLTRDGPGPLAFTITRPFPPPGDKLAV